MHSDQIIIVGGGLAGTAAAAILGKQGVPVTLIEPRPKCPAVFKAEKIEADQAEILGKWGLLQPIAECAGHIRHICRYFDGKMFISVAKRQYGLYYKEMVEALRSQLTPRVQVKRDRVKAICNSAQEQCVYLENGEEVAGRLIVLASGFNPELPSSVGLKRSVVRAHHSVAIAFNLARTDGTPFPFDALTYYSVGSARGVDYLTLFRFRDKMRANLFAFPEEGDVWRRAFFQDPERELARCFPKLRPALGDYRIEPKIESSTIHLYRTENQIAPGVVLIGDAAQNSCPSTGMGLSKLFTDVDLLCGRYVPEWLTTPGMDAAKIAAFVNDPQKQFTDRDSLESAEYRRAACTGRSLRWRLHRKRLYWSMHPRKHYVGAPVAASGSLESVS